jgi:PmbA protein
MDTASAAYGRRSLHLAATNGFAGGYTRTDWSLSAVAITGDGTKMERDWYGESRTYGADLPTPEEVGRRAGERTVARAGARKPPTGAFPVLYDERVASSLVGHILAATNGAAIVRGASWLRDALGERILPEGLSIEEDPHRPRVAGSRPFDGEGLPTRRRLIVDGGRSRGLDARPRTARKLGLQSTGNAARGTSGPPSPSNGNIALTQGTRRPRRSPARHGARAARHLAHRLLDQPEHGRLFARRLGLLDRERRVRLPGQRMHRRGQSARHAPHPRPRERRPPWTSRVVPSLLVEGLTLAGE